MTIEVGARMGMEDMDSVTCHRWRYGWKARGRKVQLDDSEGRYEAKTNEVKNSFLLYLKAERARVGSQVPRSVK